MTITYPFYIDETETTHAFFVDVVGFSNGVNDNCPTCAENYLSFDEALLYANLRSRRAGLRECYDLSGCHGPVDGVFDCSSTDVSLDHTCDGYRLPTRAEWVWAARADGTTDYICGTVEERDCMHRYGQFDRRRSLPVGDWNKIRLSYPVGRRCPTARGLYDMYGNVAEYVWEEASFPEWWPVEGEVNPVPPNPVASWPQRWAVNIGSSPFSGLDLAGVTDINWQLRRRNEESFFFVEDAGVRLVRGPIDVSRSTPWHP